MQEIICIGGHASRRPPHFAALSITETTQYSEVMLGSENI